MAPKKPLPPVEYLYWVVFIMVGLTMTNVILTAISVASAEETKFLSTTIAVRQNQKLLDDGIDKIESTVETPLDEGASL